MKIKKIVFLISIIVIFSIIVTSIVPTKATNGDNSELSVSYRTHVQNIGWQNYVQNGEIAGTEGESKRLEAINIKLLNNPNNIKIKYQVHIQDIGWQEWKSNDEMAGTSGQKKRLEAIKICLENTTDYSIMYRVHVQELGWQDWKTDGELAGTSGQAKRLEAIQIKIIKKEKLGKLYIDTPGSGSTFYKSEAKKINITGWKMSNIKEAALRIYVDNKEIQSKITLNERADVLKAITGYGTELENPKPGYSIDLDATNLTGGRHTVKLSLYAGDTILDEKTIVINIDTDLHIKYQTHIQYVGWQGWKLDEEVSGTSGQNLRVEALKIQLINAPENTHVKYRAHIQNIGWQEWKTDGELAGTSGQSLRIEAMQIVIEGTDEYTAVYRTHIQNVGWQGWKTNGELAGTSGQSLRIEAMQIRIAEKEKLGKLYIDTPGSGSIFYKSETKKISVTGWKMSNIKEAALRVYVDNKEIQSKITLNERADVLKAITGYGTELENPKPGYSIDLDATNLTGGRHTVKLSLYAGDTILDEKTIVINIDTDLHIKYQTHIQYVGWQGWKLDEEVSGTSGQNLRVEALKIQLINAPENTHVKYRAHIQNIGWQEWKTDGELAGTSGQSLRIEALQIVIEGLEDYIVEYKSNVENKGWQQWASTGMTSGTVNQSLRVEALKIRIVKSENTVVPQVKYSNYTTKSGWSEYLKNGATLGSEEGTLKIEALKIALENVKGSASIKYQVHSAHVGWQDYVSNNAQAGVTEETKAIEAIRIKADELNGYSIEYRVFVNGIGWQDWVHDGEMAGTTGESKQIGAIQIRINIDTYIHNDSNYEDINTAKYPGYKELLDKLQTAHPTWSLKLLYTGLNFGNAVYGEYSNHSANLVPASSGSEWICPVCGTKLYDTGWYGASDKAIAYYMDPRNFLNDNNIFQFLDANKYEPTSVSLEGTQVNVNGTFLQNYASDINTACKNQGVNPYYVISRLIQENGKNGSTTSKGMDGGDGKTYYNPFNIGASGNGRAQVIANALAKAKANGWDTMEKALEGGIVFLKANWLDNYQNTLYQNRFDIDSTNGTSLYSHQYMQNLSAAYSEGNLLKGYYSNAGKTDSNLTFIIPVYEGMSASPSPRPSEGTSSEEFPMNVVVNTESSALTLRSGASTSSSSIAKYAKGTVLLSVRRGINSTWQHVVTKDGKVGYMSGEYLKQVADEKTCNYRAHIKTQSSGGLNVRTGPSTTEGFSKVDYLPDYTQITVIDDSTYKGYEGSDWVQWSRIILTDGRQAFVPSSYVVKD